MSVLRWRTQGQKRSDLPTPGSGISAEVKTLWEEEEEEKEKEEVETGGGRVRHPRPEHPPDTDPRRTPVTFCQNCACHNPDADDFV